MKITIHPHIMLLADVWCSVGNKHSRIQNMNIIGVIFLSLQLFSIKQMEGAPLPRPEPRPISPYITQGVIAGLTLIQTGIIAYALNAENEDSLKFVGKRSMFSM